MFGDTDFRKAIRLEYPKVIPTTVGLLPAFWIRRGPEAEELVRRFPQLFPAGYSVDWSDPTAIAHGTYRAGAHVDEWGCVWSNVNEGMEAIEAGLVLLRELGVEGSLTAGTILINAATALSAFGEHRRALGNFQEAFRCYGKSLPPDDQRWAALMNNMAGAYEAMGERDNAERYYRSALRVQQQGGGADIAVTHVNLAQLLGSREEWEAALCALDEPTLIWDEYYAFTCRKCAAAFEEAGMPETAKELRERAEIIHESD